jgi:hypothetical protein
MGEVVDTVVGIAFSALIVVIVIGWIINIFSGSDGPSSDFDTKDPGDLY